MIRCDDGAQVPFRKSALNGVDFQRLSSGLRVWFRIQSGWLGREAVEAQRLLAEETATNG